MAYDVYAHHIQFHSSILPRTLQRTTPRRWFNIPYGVNVLLDLPRAVLREW
jgi:hypothetical protein